jgi:hypothetical protein
MPNNEAYIELIEECHVCGEPLYILNHDPRRPYTGCINEDCKNYVEEVKIRRALS